MNRNISKQIRSFYDREVPEEGILAGYGAIIEKYHLEMPIPNNLMLISTKKGIYEVESWKVLSANYEPEDTLYKHLVFALKYEGINLLLFKKLFEKLQKKEVEELINIEPLGIYSRKIWFLYEWLMQQKINKPDLDKSNYALLLDEKLQYGSGNYAVNSSRHRIKNNLPGVVDFCPLIYKTKKIEQYIQKDLSKKTNHVISGIHGDILRRTAAFLMLKDSKASFSIEGENPSNTRAVRWGKAIGQAGNKPLSKEELIRLQQIIIESGRFVKMGYRDTGGFIGEHDRNTGEPIPDHISARWDDIEKLMNGLLDSAKKMEKENFNPVLVASLIAFGFVFIHPFFDGNGRMHRYLIHHLLAVTGFTPQGIIFPVSAAILERINDYKKVLENYSQPLLDYIQWKKTEDNNVEVLNETIDYYRYFDATKQTEFLFECIENTINNIIPKEANYLKNYDDYKSWIDDNFQMPDKLVALLVRFLEQNNGKLSKRALDKEFNALNIQEIKMIEDKYSEIFES